MKACVVVWRCVGDGMCHGVMVCMCVGDVMCHGVEVCVGDDVCVSWCRRVGSWPRCGYV